MIQVTKLNLTTKRKLTRYRSFDYTPSETKNLDHIAQNTQNINPRTEPNSITSHINHNVTKFLCLLNHQSKKVEDQNLETKQNKRPISSCTTEPNSFFDSQNP